MSWRDRVRKAKFRDFEFLADRHSYRGGKRLVVHQYPHADKSDTEEFGKEADDFRIDAYFIGENYDLEANGFLEKLAMTGAAWLTHPWLGDVWVKAHDWTRTEQSGENGYCQISIDFVPGGNAPFEPVVDKVDVAFSRIREYQTVIIEDFELEPMSNDGLTAFIADIDQHLDGLRNMISITTLPLSWANQVLNVIAGVRNDIDVLLQVPGQYATAIGSFANVLGYGADSLDFDISGDTRSRAVSRITSTAINQPTIQPSANTAVTVSLPYRVNTSREAALRSEMLVVAAAQIALADFESANERDAVLNNLVTAIDTLLPNMSDPVFQAAVSMRMSLIEALMDQDLIVAVERDLANPIPSTLIAHQMGISEAVFIARNKVRHPLFVIGRVYG